MDQLLIPSPKSKRVVIIGGGFGGINLAKKLRTSGFQIVLLDKNNYHTFQPLLYQVATGGLEPDSIAYPIRKIFRGYPDFFFRMAKVHSIRPEKNCVETDIGDIHFDFLVIVTGSNSNYFGMEGLAKNSMPLKNITEALDLRSLLLQNLEKSLIPYADREKYLNIVVVGGGPTGVETAGALLELKKHVLPHDYPEINFNDAKIYLIEASDRLLGVMSQQASQKAFTFLTKMGAIVKLKTAVKDFDGETVSLGDGTFIKAISLIWSAGVKGETIPGMDASFIAKGNRFKVDRFNKIIGSENIYAIGDVALMTEEAYPNGHPMVAQVAIQQASFLAHNLVAKENSKSLKPFKYRNLGSMATIGRNKAVADFPFIRFQGVFAWFMWMFVHLMAIVGFRNRVVVFFNWVWNYFSYDRAIRIIVRPFKKP